MVRDYNEEKARAERFEAWYKQDGLKDALGKIKQGYVNSFVNSDVNDKQGRENCYIAINIVDHIESHILTVIGGGKIAEKELKKIEREQTSNKVFNLF